MGRSGPRCPAAGAGVQKVKTGEFVLCSMLRIHATATGSSKLDSIQTFSLEFDSVFVNGCREVQWDEEHTDWDKRYVMSNKVRPITRLPRRTPPHSLAVDLLSPADFNSLPAPA